MKAEPSGRLAQAPRSVAPPLRLIRRLQSPPQPQLVEPPAIPRTPAEALRCRGLPHWTARHEAERLLGQRPLCRCCPTVVAHIELRLGSTFFLDDNPARLRQAFPATEREVFTAEILAACVLLTGRARVSLYPVR